MGEALQKNKKYTYAQFLEITKDMERAEFIEGQIILQATPTLQHQDIVGNLLFEFKTYFKGKACKPFIAPFDIILEKENEEPKRVQIFVFDKEIQMYNEPFLYSKDDVVNSNIFNNLSMELKSIFG